MNVDYFFDPVCPFCWMTSKWMRRVIPHRDLRVDWRFISLRLLNEGRYTSDQAGKRARHERGLRLLRVAAAAKQGHGVDATARLYEAFGRGIWETTERKSPESTLDFGTEGEVEEALGAAGLPEDLAAAQHDDSWDETIGRDTETALDRTGRDVGTPIITFGPPDGPSFFGPVISTLPEEQAAVEIWDSLVTLAGHPDFAELKRSMRSKVDLPVLR
jgi:2-hydroxychromene-2-carboxylate isomerase